MNLRVDLILDAEKRSPSVVTPKFLIRLASFTVPAVVLLLVAISVLGNLRLKSTYREMQSDWKILEPKKKQAIQVTQQRGQSIHKLKAFEGFMQARRQVWEQVEGLVNIVPAEIQLLSFNFSQPVGLEGNLTVRNGSIHIEGKAVGELSESNVNLLESRFRTEKPFSDTIQSVRMQGQADTSPGAGPRDRTFVVDYAYVPRKFLP